MTRQFVLRRRILKEPEHDHRNLPGSSANFSPAGLESHHPARLAAPT